MVEYEYWDEGWNFHWVDGDRPSIKEMVKGFRRSKTFLANELRSPDYKMDADEFFYHLLVEEYEKRIKEYEKAKKEPAFIYFVKPTGKGFRLQKTVINCSKNNIENLTPDYRALISVYNDTDSWIGKIYKELIGDLRFKVKKRNAYKNYHYFKQEIREFLEDFSSFFIAPGVAVLESLNHAGTKSSYGIF